MLSTDPLYLRNKPVVELKSKDFSQGKLNKSSFMGDTVDLLQLYSPSCPHCKNYVGEFTNVAQALQLRGANSGALNVSNYPEVIDTLEYLENGRKKKGFSGGIPALFSVEKNGLLKKYLIMLIESKLIC